MSQMLNTGQKRLLLGFLESAELSLSLVPSVGWTAAKSRCLAQLKAKRTARFNAANQQRSVY